MGTDQRRIGRRGGTWHLTRLTSRARGITLLEFALTLPILLFTLLATIDISAVLQARSAMQQATTTSLRCVYPVDGVCSSVRGDLRERFYDYYLLPESDEGYLYAREDFSGEARFFRAPRRQFSDFRAPRLGAVYFDFSRHAYAIQGNIPSLEIDYRRLRPLAEVPTITGSDPRNPSFTINGGGAYPAAPSSFRPLASRVQIATRTSGSGTTLSLAPGQPAGGWRRAYTVRLLAPELRSLCQRNQEEGISCSSLTGEESYVAFHLKGTARTPHAHACGKVELQIRSSSGGTTPLGGQEFHLAEAGSAAMNFYPRGISPEDLGDGMPDRQEWRHGRIQVAFERDQYVEVRLVRYSEPGCDINTALEWQATDIDVYTPLFEHLAPGTTNCAPRAPDSQGGSGALRCLPGDPRVKAEYIVGEPRVLPPSGPPSVYRIPAAYSASDALLQLLESSLGSSVVSLQNLSEFSGSLSVSRGAPQTPRTFSLSCPENPGVPDLVTHEPEATPAYAIRNSARATNLCPADAEAHPEAQALMRFGPELTNVRWTETAARPIAHPPVSWVQSDCSVQPPLHADFPPALQAYPAEKLRWSEGLADPPFEIITTGREQAGNPLEDPNDPLVLKRTNPLFACEELAVGSLRYDDPNPRIPRSSLFVGTHDNIDGCDRGALLRQAAEASEIPTDLRLRADMFFSPGPRRAVARVESQELPANSCTAYELRPLQAPGLGEKIPGGPFPESVVPAACQGSVSCRRMFAHFGAGEAGSTEILASRAEELGREELYSAVPWLARQCGQGPCGQVTVRPDYPSEGSVMAVARAEVPLTTLMGGSVTLEHKHRERLETKVLQGS
jgi:hypothetical protein